ncbi:flagellar filament capping protein FliD [Campylobacter sp. IFREMER_LSEM_CL1846]|uniref:flagellar filament capping protein FliD n=1 Tax=Campylobacter sp. IFREMER_LSEM_CL1846 TaxID=2911614 RepID=UPI0021E69471|nr:flagellar filament capping protein FliD [Campylobacter sp. IFREMER_LSEM_CL1846]HEC1748410.1 flagellar filament capping protein FliD [Campylobacter lari]MCV3434122.1 flagellar filament capping protein FliD [Campylobacter sp. IFREMER_LSEM_CL1846]HEC1768202.1 flagellar filament capping protein FliD [Campylobacter lari]HEC1789510.1 flagellar filament capping protein FliD [Campylobacter lari]HEC1795815.1 flagellar filament capping protein FliD [Campylobacter lari]
MAVGSLGSLGIGSGVLTSDTLNKLKEAEMNAHLKLYNTQLETNTSRQKDLAELEAKLLAFQTAVNSLGDTSQFNKKKVSPSVSGDSAAASLVVGSLSNLSNMKVIVDQLAQKDVYQSNGFKDKTSTVMGSLGIKGDENGKASFTITQDGKDYKIEIDKSTTVAQLAEKINSATGGKIEAKLVNTGDRDNPYRLVVQSTETGTKNNISFSGNDELLKAMGWELDKNSISAGGLYGFRPQGAGDKDKDKISGSFNSAINQEEKLLSKGESTSLTFVIKNGERYDRFTIDIDENTTYKSLAEDLKKQTNGKVELSFGEDGKSFTFRATNGGELSLFDGGYATDADGNIDQANYARDPNAKNLLSKKFGIDLDYSTPQGYNVSKDNENHIQKGMDAIFSVDGVKMIRSTNTITDIGPDITLELKQKGEISFNVTQDTEAIAQSLESLATAYNDLMINLNAATKYDPDAGTKGNFVGVSSIYNIKSQINNILLQTITVDGTITVGDSDTSDGVKVSSKVSLSLADYGLTLNDGVLTFDSGKFNAKFNEDPEMAEKFFVGHNGFEDIDLTGDRVSKFDENDIEFKEGGFTITYNDETIDLSKTANGDPFKLTGADDIEKAKNLVDHINSFGLEGLEASFEIINQGNENQQIQFRIKGTSGSNLEIQGDKEFLKKFGLSPKTIYSVYKEETGTFGVLKNTMGEMMSSDGSFGGYKDSLTKESKNLNETIENTKKSIESRYDTMWSRWAAYDGIIAKLNNQASVITNMINAANNQNS